MSIAKYFLARSLYDNLVQWSGSSVVLDNEQYVIPSDEYRAQNVHIRSDTEIELSGQKKRGQDIDVVVMEAADFEWAIQEGEQFDPIYHTILADERLSELIELPKGDYIFYFAPISEEGSSSQAEISLKERSQANWDRLTGKSDRVLSWTVWIGLVLIFAPIGYMWSLYMFTFTLQISSQQLLALPLFLLLYLPVHIPLILGVYLDARKTRQVSDFPKNLYKYMIVFILPIINIIGLIAYVKRRRSVRL